MIKVILQCIAPETKRCFKWTILKELIALIKTRAETAPAMAIRAVVFIISILFIMFIMIIMIIMFMI